MPHSTREGEATKHMNPSTPLSPIGSGRLTNGSAIDNKWRRASLPVSDGYSDINGSRARSGSVISTASNATQTRRTYQDTQRDGSRDRVQRNSPLIAELRTNVIIKDEYTLVTDLSYHLAVRFSKPDTSIMINIDHSSCLALGGTFDPCYILTLTTTPSALSPDMNKRNAALIQAFMADILSVPSDRGIVRFNSIAEENYAMNGSTVYGELERYGSSSTAELWRRAGTDPRRSRLNLKTSAADLQTPTTNAVTPDKEQRAARRRSALHETPASTANDTGGEVFELAADSDGRPSSGASRGEGSSRSQPNSHENLRSETAKSATAPRLKTVAAQPNGAVTADTFADARAQTKPKHISTIIRAEQKASHMPPNIKTNAQQRPISTVNRQYSSGSKSMTSATPTPVTLTETIVANTKVLKSLDSDAGSTRANKRRSTISATPRLPPPPPVPESKTPKVSKRKSFLAAFRR